MVSVGVGDKNRLEMQLKVIDTSDHRAAIGSGVEGGGGAGYWIPNNVTIDQHFIKRSREAFQTAHSERWRCGGSCGKGAESVGV